jgi:hypothetical protein
VPRNARSIRHHVISQLQHKRQATELSAKKPKKSMDSGLSSGALVGLFSQ